MSRRIPIVGHPVRFSDWCRAWGAGCDVKAQERFAAELAAMAGKEFGLLVKFPDNLQLIDMMVNIVMVFADKDQI